MLWDNRNRQDHYLRLPPTIYVILLMLCLAHDLIRVTNQQKSPGGPRNLSEKTHPYLHFEFDTA